MKREFHVRFCKSLGGKYFGLLDFAKSKSRKNRASFSCALMRALYAKMKLKNIKSLSHNLSHSYVSFENYIDGELVFKDLKEIAHKANGKRVSIYWLYPEGKVLPLFSDRITKSIEYYKEWIPTLLEQHELDKSVITELRTGIFIGLNKQLEVQAYVQDINGKEYIKSIYEFADLKPYDEKSV